MLAGGRSVYRNTTSGELMPTVALVLFLVAGILYFRYLVPSPFPKGIGQTWSQFKLANWANPFVMALVLLAIASLRPRLGRLFNSVVLALFAIVVVSSTLLGIARISPLMHYYRGVRYSISSI